MEAKYINPFTGFGFKKIFGEETSKPLLIDFLNALLPMENKIADLSFKDITYSSQPLIRHVFMHGVICQNEKDEYFIVQLQKAEQNFFGKRASYYASFSLGEQVKQGNWDMNFEAAYCIGLLDFTFDDYESEPERNEVVHTIKLKDQRGKIFYDKLTYIYLEMPNFRKTEAEISTRLDKWLYFIKHLEDFQTIPAIFKDEVFTQAFEKAELAKFSLAEMDSYEASLKTFRDLKNTYDYAVQTAREDGIAEGKTEVAKALKQSGVSIEIIVKTTGLSENEINNL